MSPQSRGRKKKPARRSGGATVRELDPIRAVLKSFRTVLRSGDVLEIEQFTSDLLGVIREQALTVVDIDADVDDAVDGLIADLTGRPGPDAGALLHCLSVLADDEEQRAAAAAGAAAAPAWVTALADARFVEAHEVADVWGDQTSLLCTFERDGRSHGLLVLIDFNLPGTGVRDIGVINEPERAQRQMRRDQLDSGGLVRFAQCPPGRARRLIESGMAGADAMLASAADHPDPDDSDADYPSLRALALARCRAMPAAEPEPVVPQFGPAEREAIVTEFVGTAPAAADRDAWRRFARLFVDYGCDLDAGRPLRVSPGKLVTLMFVYLPETAGLYEPDVEVLAEVVPAWVAWTRGRMDLPPAAVEDLDEAVDAILDALDEAHDEADDEAHDEADDEAHDAPDTDPHLQAMLRDVPDDAPLAEIEQVLQRRSFAMPYSDATIGDEEYEQLDPADEDERHLLVVGEHPELHEALADPDFDADAAGFSPQLHITLDEIVIAQLWDDTPPQVWQAAQRLTAAGMDRLEVIHAIAAALTEQIWHTMHDDTDFDEAAYAAALATLSPSAPPAKKLSGVRAADRGPQRLEPGQVLQVKIGLLGARPPIWRRLRLPAGTTLDRLHQVIQAAFGWQDEHLHAFEIASRRLAPSSAELDGTEDSDGVPLAALLDGAGAKFGYEYDFGDSWWHEITVEKVLEPDGVGHAVCIGGRRAGPVEDCGGVVGWAHVCAVLDEPGTESYEELLDWLGDAPDPTLFDRDAINDALARVALMS